MGIKVDKRQAQEVLAQAVEWARSDRPVPLNWVELTERMDTASFKTYTPALGTALLARAVDPHVDALALKDSYAPDSYSARGLCHEVLVPAAVEYGFTIRNTGREPLNNQPFFRYDHMTLIDRVRGSAVATLNDLRTALRQLNTESQESALAGLAAFLRVRFKAAAEALRDLPDLDITIDRLANALDQYLEEGVDRPRRTQAIAAAAFDLIFDKVTTSRINDPSRHFPGDVHAFLDGAPIMAAEVRAKRVPPTEVQTFVVSLRRAHIPRAFMIAIHPSHASLDRAELVRWAWSEHSVVLTIIESSSELLFATLAWSRGSVEESLRRFPVRAAARLDQIEVSLASQTTWLALVGALDEA